MNNLLKSDKKSIWIDLGNSPHVPFFVSLAGEFEARGHNVLWTARDYAQTVQMAWDAGLLPDVFGSHGGRNLISKGLKFTARFWDLAKWSRGKKIDLVVSHNSLEPLAVGRMFGINSVNLMDYEHHPNNHVSFRLAKKVIVPTSFPDANLRRFGASKAKTRRFNGIKEDVYLASFDPDPEFPDKLKSLGVSSEDILIVVRPHAPDALYNRHFKNGLLDQVLDSFATAENTKIIVLPRNAAQGNDLRLRHTQPNIIFPKATLDGSNLIAAADLVLSGGGTMNREAAALGVPTATIFTGLAAAIDEYLCSEGRMIRIESIDDIDSIKLVKKQELNLRGQTAIRKEVADLILE